MNEGDKVYYYWSKKKSSRVQTVPATVLRVGPLMVRIRGHFPQGTRETWVFPDSLELRDGELSSKEV